MIEVTLRPAALADYASAFWTVRRELCALIERERPTVLHAISFPACLYAALAARATGVPLIWHEHNIKRIHAVNTRLYRFVASTCAWVVGPSRAVTDNLATAGLPARKLVPLYNGIDLAKFAPDDARARPRASRNWAGPTARRWSGCSASSCLTKATTRSSTPPPRFAPRCPAPGSSSSAHSRTRPTRPTCAPASPPRA